MEIILEKVEKNKKDVLYRLLQFSLFDLSRTDGSEMNEQAVFEYRWFENYFTDSDREAYFIKEKSTGKLLGFVMLNTFVQKVAAGHSIAEFMVIPKYRRNGVGKSAAIQCFEKHQGNWEVSPAEGSEKAYLFWKHTIDEHTGGKNRFEDGIFLFSNQGR
ncbi:MAG: GNAT family N-acetyltransferase [Clostridiales bacterium]|nr:GNAT family N-acetyltransferase [Clostridiales bacterium]